MKIKRNIIRATILLISSMLINCGGGGGGGPSTSGGGGTPTLPTKTTAITIDNPGIVPLINNNPTSSVIYIHNNTNRIIRNISYEAIGPQSANLTKISQAYKQLLNKIFGLNSSVPFINPNSAAQCATIGPNSSCPLSFTTPTLSAYAAQGSTIVVAHYVDGGNSGMFSQIINYAYVNDNVASGIQIMSGGGISGYGNKTGYTTIYAYGTGINQNFLVNSLTTSQANTAIVNGNVTGSTIQSGFVQAIEISGQISNSQYGLVISLQSTNQQSSAIFNSQSSMTVFDAMSEPHLLVGLVPVVDCSESWAGKYPVYVVNITNSNITGIQVTDNNKITIDQQSVCSMIPSNGNCTMYYSLPGNTGNDMLKVSGNTVVGTVEIPVSDSQAIIWFNSESGPLLNMFATPNPVSFAIGTTSGGDVTVNVSSLGKIDVESIDVSSINVTTGSAKATLLSDITDTCTGAKIPANVGACSYHVRVTDSLSENGVINLIVKGKYLVGSGIYENYTRNLILNYIANPNDPAITISILSDMQVNGNNQDFVSQNVQIVNSGDANANITNINLINTGDPTQIKIIDASLCSNKILAPKATCAMALKLGPINNPSTIALRSVTTIAVPYTGGAIRESVTALSNSFNAIVNPTGQNIIITSITAQSSDSGTGVSGDPYIFKGSNNALNKAIIVTYQNRGSHQVTIRGFDYTVNPVFWSASHNCSALKPQDTCDLTFNNLLTYNILAISNVGSSYDMNLPLPGIVFSDLESTFYTIPSYNNVTDVKVTAKQATVVNSVTLESNTVTVVHRLANAIGYSSGNIKVQSDMENYFMSSTPSSSECSVTQDSDDTITQLCNFNNIDSHGNEDLSVAYPLEPSGSDMALNVLFQAIPVNGMVFSMTPQDIEMKLPILNHKPIK